MAMTPNERIGPSLHKLERVAANSLQLASDSPFALEIAAACLKTRVFSYERRHNWTRERSAES